MSQIPEEFSKIIIHKDGPFYPNELEDLKELTRDDRAIVPISITSTGVPRLFSSNLGNKFLPRPGLVFPLSSNEFLMSTTLVTSRYLPEERGWPNPILIRIHETSKRLPTAEKLRMLYQIWSLTRLTLGSQLPFRQPLTIHYSNQMTVFLRKAGKVEPTYFKNLSGKRNRHGYLPRIFM